MTRPKARRTSPSTASTSSRPNACGENVVLEFDAAPRSDDARYLELGVIDGKHWTAIVTYRGEHKDIVRIISVRRSRDYEEDTYEQHKDD